MKKLIEDRLLREALLAVADGEADAVQRQRAYTAMAQNPELARFVLNQQRTRESVRRALDELPEPSGVLREMVQTLPRDRMPGLSEGGEKPASGLPAELDTVAPASAPRESVSSQMMAWLPVTAAAAVAVLTTALYVMSPGVSRPSAGATGGPGGVKSAAAMPAALASDLADALAGRHVSCSRLLTPLHEGGPAGAAFPSEVKDLPRAIGEYLGRPTLDSLDLSAAGYRFDGAGASEATGSRSVHLIYRPIDRTRRDDALSLWVQPDGGGLSIQPDTIYPQGGQDAVHPLVLWKHGGVLYYLVGDDAEAVTKAARQLSGPR